MARDADEVLADLARHPGWAILTERVMLYQTRQSEDLARHLLRSKDQVDPIELAYQRGVGFGMRWMLRHARNELTAFRAQDEKEGVTSG